MLPYLSAVITTSRLAAELAVGGCRPERIEVLCCLSAEQEVAALSLAERQPGGTAALAVLFIDGLIVTNAWIGCSRYWRSPSPGALMWWGWTQAGRVGGPGPRLSTHHR